MKFFKTENSDLNTSDQTVYVLEPIRPVTSFLFCDTDVILDSSPDIIEYNKLTSAPPISAINSKSIDTGPTVQTSTSSEEFTSSSEILINTFVNVQRLPLSPVLVALVITPNTTFRPIQINYPSDRDRTTFH